MALQGLKDTLIEIGKFNGMERNVNKTKVMICPRQPSPVQIMADQKQLENVEYLNYLDSMITSVAR